MANESKKNKGLIIGICVAIVVVIAIIIAVVLGVKGGGLGDSYFVSDDTKYVLNMDASDMSFDDEEYAPTKVHLVYTYSGEDVTGLKAYYEYENAEAAKAAFDYINETQADSYKSIVMDGKYIILEAKEDEYKDITPDDVKQQIEFMEMLKNMNTSTEGESNDEETEGEEIVDTGEGEIIDDTEETVEE